MLVQRITQIKMEALALVALAAFQQEALQLKATAAVEQVTEMLVALAVLLVVAVELVVAVVEQPRLDQIPLAVLPAMVEMDVRSQYQVHLLPMLAVVVAVEIHTAVAYLRELVEQAAAVLAV